MTALALAGCHGEDPDRFDLSCSGKTTVTGGVKDHQSTRTQAWSDRYIVDLKAKKWCRPGDCTTLSDFEDITPDTLSFDDVVSADEPPEFSEQAYVRRTTGEFVANVTPILPEAPGDGGHTSGTCRKARFSGFPKRRF